MMTITREEVGRIKKRYYEYSRAQYRRLIKTPADEAWLREEVRRISNKYDK